MMTTLKQGIFLAFYFWVPICNKWRKAHPYLNQLTSFSNHFSLLPTFLKHILCEPPLSFVFSQWNDFKRKRWNFKFHYVPSTKNRHNQPPKESIKKFSKSIPNLKKLLIIMFRRKKFVLVLTEKRWIRKIEIVYYYAYFLEGKRRC